MNKTHYQRGIRIIAGKHRRRKIDVLDAPGLRPTPDRVRETLFNWLQYDISQASILDAFAGSGILGLESLSRGAGSVHFIEKDAHTAQKLRQTLQMLGEKHARIDIADSLSLPARQRYDIIFLDPPFAAQLHQKALEHFADTAWLKPQGFIYLEMPQPLTTLTLPDDITWYKQHSAGKLHFGLLRRNTDE